MRQQRCLHPHGYVHADELLLRHRSILRGALFRLWRPPTRTLTNRKVTHIFLLVTTVEGYPFHRLGRCLPRRRRERRLRRVVGVKLRGVITQHPASLRRRLIRRRAIQRLIQHAFPRLRHRAVLSHEHLANVERDDFLKTNRHDVRRVVVVPRPSLALVQPPAIAHPLPDVRVRPRRFPIRVPRPREHPQRSSLRVRVDGFIQKLSPHRRRRDPPSPLARQRMRAFRRRRRRRRRRARVVARARAVEIAHPRARRLARALAVSRAARASLALARRRAREERAHLASAARVAPPSLRAPRDRCARRSAARVTAPRRIRRRRRRRAATTRDDARDMSAVRARRDATRLGRARRRATAREDARDVRDGTADDATTTRRRRDGTRRDGTGERD